MLVDNILRQVHSLRLAGPTVPGTDAWVVSGPSLRVYLHPNRVTSAPAIEIQPTN